MGKKSSNPMNVLKSSINKASDVVSKTYDEVSKDVSKTAAQIIPVNMINDKKDEPKKEPKSEIKTIVEEVIKQELNPYESQIQSLYVGCFSDDPSNPSMEKDLGDVSNSLECIELGKKNNYNFIEN